MFKHRRKFFFFIPFVIAGILLLAGWVVMLLWNAILPAVVTGVSALTYWQAVGLLLLSRLLFGGFRGGGGQRRFGRPSPWRSKWMNMSEEERVRFKAEWKERCRPGGE